MPRKMIPALPESNESAHDRFKRFAHAILSVPKTEIETPEQAIARLQSEKRQIERQIDLIRRAKAKKRAAKAPTVDLEGGE